MANIKDRIKELRKEKCLTQEELAKMLGLSAKSNIANYESGANAPSDEIKLKMCEIFNCTMDYLMGKSNFKTNEEELSNYLNIEIKDDLIKKLKALELDEVDLKKAITAFIENYIYVTDEFSVKIYDMEDSLVYFAYELITKYYFKLIHKELEILTNASNSLVNNQIYLEKAEKYAWSEMKDILESIDNNLIISDLTAEQKAHKFISNLEITSKVYMCPVYGQISAGQPNWAEECIEGRLPIDPNLMNIVDPEECYFLRVNGESMNKVVKNGAYALIRKTDWVDDGEIAVVLVNGYDATLKKFSKQGDFVVLEPMSNDPSFQTQIYTKDTPIKIIGKYIGKFEMKN